MPTKDKYISLDPLPVAWMISTFVVCIMSATAIWIWWDSIPDPIPIHWATDGQPDDWIPKTPGRVTGFLALGAGVLGTLAVVVPWLIHHHARHAHRGLPKKTTAEINQARVNANEMMKLVSAFLFIITAFTMTVMTYSLIGGTGWPIPPWATLLGGIVLIVWMINRVRIADQRITTQGATLE